MWWLDLTWREQWFLIGWGTLLCLIFAIALDTEDRREP